MDLSKLDKRPFLDKTIMKRVREREKKSLTSSDHDKNVNINDRLQIPICNGPL